MSHRKCNRWSLEGVLSRGRRGCSSQFGGLLSFITSLRFRLQLETEGLRERTAHPSEDDHEGRDMWRERAAMLERNLDEAKEGGRKASRLAKRRRRRAAPGFEFGKVRWGRVHKITTDCVYVRINGVDWPVCVPELSWGDAQSPLEILAPGQPVGVKTLSTPGHSKHPFLLLQLP